MKRTPFAIATATVAILGCTAQMGSAPDQSSPDGATATSHEALVAPPPRGRPANVSSELVETPNGYVHPSCIVDVASDERVDGDGSVVRTDGTRRAIPRCEYARYDSHGEPIHASSVTGPYVAHDWLADFFEDVSNITWTSATFTVPVAPLSNSGQVVYLFNGIEASDFLEIIQPVLEWNQSGYGGRWTAATWDVKCDSSACSKPTSYRSTPVNVSPGDTISGYLYPTGSGGWFIGMNRNGSYLAGLSATSSKTFDVLVGGVLEVWYLSSCKQLPSSGYEFFTSQAVYQGGVPITPSWSTFDFAVSSPSCNVSAFAGTTVGGITWLYE